MHAVLIYLNALGRAARRDAALSLSGIRHADTERKEYPMATRTTGTHPHYTDTIARVVVAALVVMLFVALVLFVWLAPIRFAYGGLEVFSEGAAIMAPVAAEGIVAIVSAAMTAAAVVWLYLRHLAH
jgi:hypothetical protein